MEAPKPYAIAPMRPPDTPQRWMARLARAVVEGRLSPEDARARFETYVAARASGEDVHAAEKTATWMRHYLAHAIRNMPTKDLPTMAANGVKLTELDFGSLVRHVPAWGGTTRNGATAALYARLCCFALLLGAYGRRFEMAQGMTAGLFGCGTGYVTEFVRKATKHDFLRLAVKGRKVTPYDMTVKGRVVTRWRRSADIYELGDFAHVAKGLEMQLRERSGITDEDCGIDRKREELALYVSGI